MTNPLCSNNYAGHYRSVGAQVHKAMKKDHSQDLQTSTVSNNDCKQIDMSRCN